MVRWPHPCAALLRVEPGSSPSRTDIFYSTTAAPLPRREPVWVIPTRTALETWSTSAKPVRVERMVRTGMPLATAAMIVSRPVKLASPGLEGTDTLSTNWLACQDAVKPVM